MGTTLGTKQGRQRIGVLGAGNWGTAIAKVLAEKGHDVTLWSFEAEVAAAVNERHENTRYLAGFKLPENLRATTSAVEAVDGMQTIFQVTPSHGVRALMREVAEAIPHDTPIVSATKGIENETLMTVSEVLEDVLPERQHPYLVFLGGPSFAREVADGSPTAVILAGQWERIVMRVQETMKVGFMRSYRTNDVPGVEMGGAIKNVLAIGAGAVEGMKLGHNTLAAVITRGLAEMTRLAVQKGANPLTLAGLAGMGDLVLTCTGPLSRNRTVGYQLGLGKSLDEVLASMQMVAEGVKTARAVHDLAARYGTDMPICESVYRVLYENLDPATALLSILSRDQREEWRLM